MSYLSLSLFSKLFDDSDGFCNSMEHLTCAHRHILCLSETPSSRSKSFISRRRRWFRKQINCKSFGLSKTKHSSYLLYCKQVLSFLSLGGACAVASATELLLSIEAPICGDNFCSHYQVSATLAFLCWFLLLSSALFNLWSLPSL